MHLIALYYNLRGAKVCQVRMEESKMAPDEAVNIEGERGREQNAWLMNIKIDLYSAAVRDEREMNPELKGETCYRKDELQEKTDNCNKKEN